MHAFFVSGFSCSSRRSSQIKVGSKESEKWKCVTVQMMSDESSADELASNCNHIYCAPSTVEIRRYVMIIPTCLFVSCSFEKLIKKLDDRALKDP